MSAEETALSPELEALKLDYVQAKKAEEAQWWKLPAHRVPIFAYNPQWTYFKEKALIVKLRTHLKDWTERWMNSRGYLVTFSDEPVKDGFYIERRLE